MTKHKVIDLFAGIGGIRMGFDRAFKEKLETVFVCEWDKSAQETYKANYKDGFEITGDITKVKPVEVPKFDICLAGFPCQAFSNAGLKEGFNDSKNRGVLFLNVVEICEKHKPKVIFLENVKNLLKHDGGKTFERIMQELEDIGYTIFYKVIKSKDYGVPQGRERIYIVAFRDDIDSKGFEWPEPSDSGAVLAEIIEQTPVQAKYYISAREWESIKSHKERHKEKGAGFGYEIRGVGGVAGTLMASTGSLKSNLVVDGRKPSTTETSYKGEMNNKHIRKMTPREMARLQGFPDTFELPKFDTNAYKQLGNSVTVPVIEAIANNVKKVIDKHDKNDLWKATHRKALVMLTEAMLKPEEENWYKHNRQRNFALTAQDTGFFFYIFFRYVIINQTLRRRLFSLKIEIKKEDIIPYVYFVCSFAHGAEAGMYGSLGGKSDYIGGILDRFINIIPESIIFNNYFLPKAVEKSGKKSTVTVYSDFYKYDPKMVGIAPDVIGLRIDGRTIPFVKYDDTKPNTEFWVPQKGCPQIEVKSFFGKKYMVSLRDQHYGDKFLVMVGANLAVDYLLPFFSETVFNDNEIKKLEMPNDFIISDTKGLLSQTERIGFEKTNLGSLQLLTVTTASAFREVALELQGGDIPRYFVDVTQRTDRGLVKEHTFNPNLPLSHFCEKQSSNLYRFNANWYTLFTTPKEKTLDIHIENAKSLLVVKKTTNAVAVLAMEDAVVNDFKLEKGKQYNINFGTFGSIAGREYFVNKGLLKHLPNKEQEMLDAITDVVKKS